MIIVITLLLLLLLLHLKITLVIILIFFIHVLLQLLVKSDALNCQQSMIELITNSYAQKAALWCLYGKTEMSCLSSQLLLRLNTANPTQGIHSYNAEGTCQAICNVADILMDQVCLIPALCVFAYVACIHFFWITPISLIADRSSPNLL